MCVRKVGKNLLFIVRKKKALSIMPEWVFMCINQQNKITTMCSHESEGNIVWKLYVQQMYSDLINQEKDNVVLPKDKIFSNA